MHSNITYNPLQQLSAKHIDEDCNVVVLAPTSAGKTIVSEQFLFSSIEQGKKSIYLSPLKALTEEKKRAWTGTYDMTVVTSDYNKPHTFNTPLILMTTEALDSKTRGNPQWLQSVGCVAVDEAHLIASPNRGDALEIGLMRFTQINREARIVLLSATIPNAKILANWLTRLNGKNTVVVETDWRPVVQEHHLFKSGAKPWNVIDDTLRVSEALLREQPEKQQLIFVHAVGRGHKISEKLGCPFHYSKLTKEKRAAIEEAFMQKKIRRLVCTSTLAYGVNLPADICIISGGTRGPAEVDPIDIKQEAGRAGRYGLSEKGDVYYIFEDFLCGDYYQSCLQTPPVNSVLNNRLYFHIVSFVHRENMQLDEIKTFMGKSFGSPNVNFHVSRLKEAGALKNQDYLEVTKYGKAASLLYLDPLDLLALANNLSSRPTGTLALARAFAYIPSNDIPCYIPEEVDDHLKKYKDLICPAAQQSIYAACLHRWMSGHDMFGTFAVTTPVLTRDIERWIAALGVCGLPQDYLKAISIMLSKGIPYHLIELAEIKGIGQKKAFKLFEVNIKTKDDLLKEEVKGRSILGKKLYDEIKAGMPAPEKIILTF